MTLIAFGRRKATEEYSKISLYAHHPTVSLEALSTEMDGYDKVADLMGDHHEACIFRRFSTLGAKNILYLQAELVNLEAELRRIATDDRNSGDPEKEPFPYSLWHLKDSLRSPGTSNTTQWLKVLEIRQKLKEYCQYSYFGRHCN